MSNAAVNERLAAYSAAWSAIAAGGIASHWHADRFRFYKPEEFRTVYTDWEATLAYWRGNEALHEAITLTFGEVTDLGLPGPVKLVTFDMDWAITFAADARDAEGRLFRHAGRKMAGWTHVMAAFGEADGEWKLTGWLEAPDAPPVYMTDLYYRMGEREG